MVDPYMLLAPVLLLAVIALLRFVGCELIFPLVGPPDPVTTGLDPASATVCGPGFQLKVSGTGFVSGSQVQWNGANRTTGFISATQLEADISEDDIGAKGTAQVTVANGSLTSSPLPFEVVPGTPNAVRFDPQPPQVANSGDILNGIYKNLDFGISQWRWSFQPNGSVISLTTSAPSSFSFVNGKRILASVVVFPTAAGNIKLSDGGTNPDVLLSLAPTGSFQTVPTNWTKCAKTATVEFSGAPPFSVLEIAYLGPP